MRSRFYVKGFIYFILLFLWSYSFAITPSVITTPTNNAVSEKVQFDIAGANRILDQFNIQISTEKLNKSQLEAAINQLTKEQAKAKECVNLAQDDLNETNKLWGEAKTGAKEPEELTSVQQYLKEKNEELTKRHSDCKLFVLRSTEAVAALSKASENLSKQELLKVQPNFWEKLVSTNQITRQLHAQFNTKTFIENSGWLSLNNFYGIIFLGTCFVFFIAGLFLRRFFKNKTSFVPQTYGQKLYFALNGALQRYVVFFLIGFVLVSFTSILGKISNQINHMMLVSYVLFAYVGILFLIHFFFYSFMNKSSISGISVSVTKPLTFRLKCLAALLTVSMIFYILFQKQNVPLSIVDLSRTIFITLLSISLISIMWLVNRVPKLLYRHGYLRLLLNFLLTCVLLIILVTEWLGYQQLVNYILKGISLTLALFFVVLLLNKLIQEFLQSFNDNRFLWQEDLRVILGLRGAQPIPEVFWLRIVSFILLWGSFIIFLLKVWGLSSTKFTALIAALMDGFTVAGILIVPSRILSALIFFIIVFLFIRWLKTSLEMKKRKNVDAGAQQAVAAIFAYVSVAIIFLIALIIAGVNFAGLAIIAGALSVGIGFGLQNIVNNFVSGIILLLERPIKPGDRIVIGDTEGFVKKISIRATQIQTLLFSDIIVPNAEIISSRVTNLMFKDFYARVSVSVGVAYGSDAELVRKVLFQVAHEHPEVITNDPALLPFVYFKEFGDSSLVFNLYCVIRNVNLKYVVMSELNFAIDKAFRENNIVIAFPQRDIHIRDWTQVQPQVNKKEESSQ